MQKTNLKELKVTEIGASSLLDFDYNNHRLVKGKYDIKWNKFYNRNKPKYKNKEFTIKHVKSNSIAFRRELFNNSAVIYSIGNKGPRKRFGECDPDEMFEIMHANFGRVVETLGTVIDYQKRNGTKHLKVIFMGSVAGKDNNTYPNHSMYAASKAALASLVRNVKEEYKMESKISFHLLEIPYTSSRMTSGKGESPEELRETILNLIIS